MVLTLVLSGPWKSTDYWTLYLFSNLVWSCSVVKLLLNLESEDRNFCHNVSKEFGEEITYIREYLFAHLENNNPLSFCLTLRWHVKYDVFCKNTTCFPDAAPSQLLSCSTGF